MKRKKYMGYMHYDEKCVMIKHCHPKNNDEYLKKYNDKHTRMIQHIYEGIRFCKRKNVLKYFRAYQYFNPF